MRIFHMTDFTKLKCAHLADGTIVAGVAGVHGDTIVRNLATGTPENFSGSATHETPLHFRAPARAQLLHRREKTEFSSADLNGGDRVKASSADLAKTALKACQGPSI
jgi:hypothetical protein